jgi:predicted O-methyltransferase YrrM
VTVTEARLPPLNDPAVPSSPISSQVRRARRRIAHWLAPELEAELRATKRKLRSARRQLRDARFDLPAPVEETIARARDEHLTYLKPDNLRVLAAAVRDVESAGLPGLIIEAGTARGGSAIVMAAAKAPARPMKVYDVFGMIPPPTERDGADVHERYDKIAAGGAKGVGGDTYYGYRGDLYEEVKDSFARLGVPVGEHNVELIRGLFEDTIELAEPVALAHLDGDWYESTMTCLTRIAPQLVPGGRIVLDDYYKWSGCRAAVDEYFKGRDGFRLEQRAKLHVIRA